MNLFNYDGKIYKFLVNFWNIVWISVLWLVCSLPVVTIGVSSCAAYYAMVKSVRNKEDNVTKDFFKSFKQNLGQGIIMTVVYLVISFGFTFATIFYYRGSGDFNLGMRWLFYILILVLLCTMSYAFTMLSRFKVTTLHALTYPVAFSLMHLKNSIGLIVFRAAAIIVLYWSFNTFWFAILILMMPGFICFLDTFMLEPVLKKYEPLAIAEASSEKEETSDNTDTNDFQNDNSFEESKGKENENDETVS